MKRLGKFLRLPSPERNLFVRALVIIWVTRLGLWLLPLRILPRIVSRTVTVVVPVPAQGRAAEEIVRAVARASRYVPSATCLTQALAAQALLARHGYAARLRIGIARPGPESLEAHAWVESQGEAVVGGGWPVDYVSLPFFDGEAFRER